MELARSTDFLVSCARFRQPLKIVCELFEPLRNREALGHIALIAGQPCHAPRFLGTFLQELQLDIVMPIHLRPKGLSRCKVPGAFWGKLVGASRRRRLLVNLSGPNERIPKLVPPSCDLWETMVAACSQHRRQLHLAHAPLR